MSEERSWAPTEEFWWFAGIGLLLALCSCEVRCKFDNTEAPKADAPKVEKEGR